MRPADPYVVDVLRRLFPDRPGPRTVVAAGAPPPGSLDFFALPSTRRATVLVPAGRRDVAVMLARHGGGARRVVRRVVAAAVATGAAARVPLPRLRLEPRDGGSSTETLEDLLVGLVGPASAVGVLLGPPRPNRKPVLQVFGEDGDVLAFVKVGTDQATRALVDREARTLRHVLGAGLTVVRPPDLLHAGGVTDTEVLVLAPLGSSQQSGRDPGVAPPLAAMAEVAGSSGTHDEPLAAGRFWGQVVAEVDGVTDPVLQPALRDLLGRLHARHGTVETVMGSWHGDWAPWNMGVAGDRVEVWDWERYSDAVPWGLDLVHFLAQRVRHLSEDRAEQEGRLLAAVPEQLAAMGGPGRRQDPEVLLLAYLLTIALRFAPATRSAGPHPRATWALALADRVLRGGMPG